MRKMALGPLAWATGAMLGVPLMSDLYHGTRKWLQGAAHPQAQKPGQAHLGQIGGIAPKAMSDINAMTARMAMRNYQMRNIMNNLRAASPGMM